MTSPRYVDSVSGSNTEAYDTKAKAADTLTTVLASATAIVAGDEILVAEGHSDVETGSVAWQFPTTSVHGKLILVRGIDFSDDSIASPRPQLGVSSGVGDMSMRGGVVMEDVDIHCGDDMTFNISSERTTQIFKRVLFSMDRTSSATISIIDYGVTKKFIDCDFDWGGTDGNVSVASCRGGSIVFDNCRIPSGSAAISSFFGSGSFFGASYTGKVVINGFDFTNAASSGFELIADTMSTGDATAIHYISGIKMPTGGVLGVDDTDLEGDGSGIVYVDEDGLTFFSAFGSVISDNAIYLSDTTAGGSNHSFAFSANSDADERTPLRWEIDEFWAAADATITVEMWGDHATPLDESELWIEVEYPDPVSSTIRKIVTTFDRAAGAVRYSGGGGSPGSDPGWTATGTNEVYYAPQVVLDSSAGRVNVYVCVANGAAVDVNVAAPTVT